MASDQLADCKAHLETPQGDQTRLDIEIEALNSDFEATHVSNTSENGALGMILPH